MTGNRKLTGWLLTVALLLAVVFPAGAFAATGDVVSIEIEGSGSPIELTVGKSTKQLKVWGTVEGSSVKRDLTRAVEWSSDKPEIISVNNGFVTPLKSGSAIITAVYNNSAVSTIEIKAVDTYKELTLEYSAKGKYKLGTNEKNLTVTALAAIEGSQGDTKDVTADADWSSSNSLVLTIEKGKITLVGEGDATITAKYKGLTASFKATVSSPYSELNILRAGTSVTDEDVELLIGDDEVALTAQSTLTSDKSTLDVTAKAKWTSSDSNIATIEEGKLKAKASGKATITAEYLGVKAKTDVYVRAPYEVILLKPAEDQLIFIGEKLQLEAEMRSRANSTDSVTGTAEWNSSSPLSATVSQGLVTGMTAGSSTIKVSHLGVSKSIKVTVAPTITDLTVEKTELEMFKNDKLSLPKVTATKLDDDKIDFSSNMKWTSDNEDIAKIEDGKIIAKDSGKVTLTGKLSDSEVSSPLSIRAKSVSIELTVKEKVLTFIMPDEKMSLVIGEETPLPKVTAVWEDGGEGDVSDDIEWTVTGANAVVKTTPTGKVVKGLNKGSATLKGTYSNKMISVPMTIEPKITKIVVEPTSIELNVKKSKSIKVTGYYADGKKVTLSSKVGWQSSNVQVATISSTSVKAVAEGTATLTGSYQGQAISVKVSVVPKLTKLTVDEKSLKLAPGYVKTVKLTAEYDTGASASVSDKAVWTTSKASVAKVTNGKIEAVGKGSATIKAKFGDKTVSVRVTVK
ncbi:Ig-like domain-containing protein [Paenibacillus motobuensis]|uniref:BIG2 domain-containing protein n=1 Tax=Paenibacillus motobuensis TaxID=295324 RepID=A0ABN0YVM0_9BACL